MPHIEYNNSKIYYEIYGNGEPILFIHGWHGSSLSFKKNLLELLREKFQIIIVDLPGYGKSDPIPLSFKAFSNIINRIIDKYHIKEINLIGFCMGAVIALDYAIRNSEKIKKLILIEAYITFPKIIYPLLIKKINYYIFHFFVHKNAGLYFIKKYLLEENASYRKDFFDVIQNNDLNNSLDYIRLLWDYSRYNHIDRIKNISVPICLIMGENTHRSIHKATETIKSCIPSSEVITIKGCRHFPIEENSSGLSEIIQYNLH